MQHAGKHKQSETRPSLAKTAIQGPQKEAPVHVDECQVPAAAPEFGERGGGPGTVEQERNGEAGPAQQPRKQVADTEVDGEEERCHPREAKEPVRNARGADRGEWPEQWP